MIVAEVTLHAELVQGCAKVHADLFLLRVVPHTHAYVIAATFAPYIVRHLESNNEDTHVEFASSLAQRMGTEELIEPTDAWIIVGWVVQVCSLALPHCSVKLNEKLLIFVVLFLLGTQ